MIAAPANGPLYIRILGRMFLVTGIAESRHEANDVCFRDATQSVIDTMGDLAILARADDKGISLGDTVSVNVTRALAASLRRERDELQSERDQLAARLTEIQAIAFAGHRAALRVAGHDRAHREELSLTLGRIVDHFEKAAS